MELEWDEAKNLTNRDKHGLDFAVAYDFPWDDAVLVDRSRHADGEPRLAAIGWLHGKLYTAIFTKRGANIRIISFRRANSKEEKFHDEAKNT